MSLEVDDINEYNSANLANNIKNEQNELILHFFEMGFVASTLEDAIILPNPIVKYDQGLRELNEEQYKEDKILVEKYRTKNIRLCKKLNKKIEIREILFSRIREIYPSFCKDVDKKIPREDYEFYLQQRKKLKDIIFYKSKSSILEKRASDLDLEIKDNMSELIDSEDFSKVCLIEDKFMISEFEKYFEILKTAPMEVQHLHKKCKIPYNETNISVEELAKKFVEKRCNRILKLNQILELFDKLNSKKYVQIPNAGSEPFEDV